MHRDIVSALVVPGWLARDRRRGIAAALLAAGVVAPAVLVLYLVFTDRRRLALSLDADVLGITIVVLVAAIVTRVAAAVELWDAAGRRRPSTPAERVALVGAALVLVAASVVTVQIGRVRAAIDDTFTPADEALYDAVAADDSGAVPLVAAETPSAATGPATGTTLPSRAPATTEPREGIVLDPAPSVVVTTTTEPPPPPLPARPDAGVDRALLTDVSTVLLLGGDAGPGRYGLRTDTMMLFSLHRPSGRAALVSVPRNLERLLFPPGSALQARHPYGFDDIANAVYPRVMASRQLRDSYTVGEVRPGVVALAQAIGYSLDVTIDDYVLVDMQGFLEVVDALGGVTVDVARETPMPGNVPGAPTAYPDTIGPGRIEMDGTTALGYVRSRSADSDHHRTRRQRELLAALGAQVSWEDVLPSFVDVASAVGGTLRTSLTADELTEALAVIGGGTAIVESVGLSPPRVSVRRPNYDAMAKMVGAIQMALVTGEASGI